MTERKDPPSGHDVAHFAMADDRHKQIETYVAEGRCYAKYLDNRLALILGNCLAILVFNPIDPEARKLLDDCIAEYELRNVEPPYDRFRALFEKFVEKVLAHVAGIDDEELADRNENMYRNYCEAHDVKN